MQDTSKRTIVENITFVIVVSIICILVICLVPHHAGWLYDCSLSEISPDYPIKVKEECRKLRASNNLQKPK